MRGALHAGEIEAEYQLRSSSTEYSAQHGRTIVCDARI